MNLKQFLPFENYILTTQLSVDEVCKRLADNIEPKRSFRYPALFTSTIKPYEGEIKDNRFRINRIINYRNSFLPMIEGEVSTFTGHTQIHIIMKPVVLAIIFICFWLGITGLLGIRMLINELLKMSQNSMEGSSPAALIPFGMFIFGCLITSLGFKLESNQSKKFLAMLLNGEEMN